MIILIHEASGDYFSAESYSGILYKEIPNYKLDGSIKFIRDQIDFRPAVKELRNGSGTIGAPYYVNCTTFDFVSRVFDTTGGSAGSTIFDIMQVNSSFPSRLFLVSCLELINYISLMMVN